jgi:hypothetical protein
MALVVLLVATTARAADVSDELTVGALSSGTQPASSPYVSDRLGGALDASERVALSLDGTYTRYLKANHVPAENIFQIAAAADYTPSDHWAFGVDLRASPPSTAVTSTPAGTVRSRTSLVAAGLSAEYDTAGDGPSETIAESYVGLTSYSTTQRARLGTKATPPSLTQFRLSPTLTEILWQDTEGELSVSYYAYSTDPQGTGYFGASVFGHGSISEGLPLEPLRWSARPTVRRRLGPMKLSAFFQYGRYVGDGGFSAITGLRAQAKVSDEWKLWASFSFQRDVESTGEVLSIPWGAIGARVSF